MRESTSCPPLTSHLTDFSRSCPVQQNHEFHTHLQSLVVRNVFGGAGSGTEVAGVVLCGELNANECSENAGEFVSLAITGCWES